MNISNLSNDKLITCILPKGLALPILIKLRDEKNINRANINSARGMGKITPLAYRGVGGQAEKEILSIIVKEEQADDVFYYIFEEADIDRPHGGIIYMRKLDMSTLYTLPADLPIES
jgi:nitrogen regulatory protein PII